MAFVIGVQGSAETIIEEIEVDAEGLELARRLGTEIEAIMSRKSIDKSVLMAALAQLGAKLATPEFPAKKQRRKLKKAS